MDNEPIFTEYELSLKRARQEVNELASEANGWLKRLESPEHVLGLAVYCGQDISKIKFNETTGQFVLVDNDFNLDPHTMEFVTPEELKRRDAENVKRLQEIIGK